MFQIHLVRCLLTAYVRNWRGYGLVGQCAREKDEKHWSHKGMRTAPKRNEALGILTPVTRFSSHSHWSHPTSSK